MPKVNEVVDLLRGKGVLIESVEAKRFSLEDVLVVVMGAGVGGVSLVAGRSAC